MMQMQSNNGGGISTFAQPKCNTNCVLSYSTAEGFADKAGHDGATRHEELDPRSLHATIHCPSLPFFSSVDHLALHLSPSSSFLLYLCLSTPCLAALPLCPYICSSAAKTAVVATARLFRLFPHAAARGRHALHVRLIPHFRQYGKTLSRGRCALWCTSSARNRSRRRGALCRHGPHSLSLQ